MQVVDFCNQMEKQLTSFETAVDGIEKRLDASTINRENTCNCLVITASLFKG